MTKTETFLANCAEIILGISEEEKAQLCDLKFICQGDNKVFNSFRLLLLATSPNFTKKILNDDSEDSVIVLPEHITYEQVFNFHQCLLSTNSEFQQTLLNSSLELITLLQIGLKSTEDTPGKIDTIEDPSKAALKCVECGKEYINQKSYLNHAKLHEKEYATTLKNSNHKTEQDPLKDAALIVLFIKTKRF